eukprot:TRINITY_DN266_c1_g1_i1.p3 TRINITY_DN266_c1_g1~~TRINITY_DN266_c1_g1_i1.p3  ORF type:complete len:539 (+),score=190.73 TRINITY_DN266_c1_g1_i1:84-1619(+)
MRAAACGGAARAAEARDAIDRRARENLTKLYKASQEQMERLNAALQRLGDAAASAQLLAAQQVAAVKQGATERTAEAQERMAAEHRRALDAATRCYERCQQIMHEAASRIQELAPALRRIADAAFTTEQQAHFAELLRSAVARAQRVLAAARSALSAKYAAAATVAAGARASVADRAAVVRTVVAERAAELRGCAGETQAAVAERCAGVYSTAAEVRINVQGSVADQLKALEAAAQALRARAEGCVAPRARAVVDTAGEWGSPCVARAKNLSHQLAQQVTQWSPDTAARLDAAYHAATACELKQAARLPSLLYAAACSAAAAALRREREHPESCGATDDSAGTALSQARCDEEERELQDARAGHSPTPDRSAENSAQQAEHAPTRQERIPSPAVPVPELEGAPEPEVQQQAPPAEPEVDQHAPPAEPEAEQPAPPAVPQLPQELVWPELPQAPPVPAPAAPERRPAATAAPQAHQGEQDGGASPQRTDRRRGHRRGHRGGGGGSQRGQRHS